MAIFRQARTIGNALGGQRGASLCRHSNGGWGMNEEGHTKGNWVFERMGRL